MANVAVAIPATAQSIKTNVGGIAKIYLRAFTEGAITDLTGFTEVGFVDGSALFTQTKVSGNGKAVEQSIELTITEVFGEDFESLRAALLADMYIQAIVSPKGTSRDFIFGKDYGLKAEVTYSVGAGLGDLFGTKVILKGFENDFATDITL